MNQWGAHSDSSLTSGVWSSQDRLLSINQLELKAVVMALDQAPLSWQHQRIVVVSDNSTMVAY
jgi:hypothetical protein